MSVHLTTHQKASQAEHNNTHPGRICSSCPVEVAHRADTDRRRDRLAYQHDRNLAIVVTSALFTVLVLLWIFI